MTALAFPDYSHKRKVPSFELATLGTLGAKLGDGRQGEVYALAADSKLVFKRYKATVDEHALASLIDWPSGLSYSERLLLQSATAWPQALVRQGVSVIGIIVPRAPERVTYLQTDGERVLTTLSNAINLERDLYQQRLPAPNDLQRLKLAYSLCRLLALFEREGLVFLDLSSKNVLWSLGSPPEVYLIDCDSAFFKSRAPVRPFRTGNWLDPWFKNPPSPEEVRGLFTLIFARLVFARQYANTKVTPLVLPPEHPFAKHFQDLVSLGYLPNLSGRPPFSIWQKRIEEILWPKKESVASTPRTVATPSADLNHQGDLERYIEYGKDIWEGFINPFGFLFPQRKKR